MLEARKFSISDFLVVAIAWALLVTFFATISEAQTIRLPQLPEPVAFVVEPTAPLRSAACECEECLCVVCDCGALKKSPENFNTAAAIKGTVAQANTGAGIVDVSCSTRAARRPDPTFTFTDCPGGVCQLPARSVAVVARVPRGASASCASGSCGTARSGWYLGKNLGRRRN